MDLQNETQDDCPLKIQSTPCYNTGENRQAIGDRKNKGKSEGTTQRALKIRKVAKKSRFGKSDVRTHGPTDRYPTTLVHDKVRCA